MDGHVTFVEPADEKTFAPWCLSRFKVSNVDGTTMWEFDAYEIYRTAKTCGPFFPMRYGNPPKGAKVIVAPQPLASGETYVISGDGRGMLSGVFRYDAVIQHKLTTYGRGAPEARAAYDQYWPTQGMERMVDASNDTANGYQ